MRTQVDIQGQIRTGVIKICLSIVTRRQFGRQIYTIYLKRDNNKEQK